MDTINNISSRQSMKIPSFSEQIMGLMENFSTEMAKIKVEKVENNMEETLIYISDNKSEPSKIGQNIDKKF